MPPAADAVFKALSDPTRRALFERLASEGEQSVHALTDYAGVAQPTVSKHLVVLKGADLVSVRPVGRESYYSARPEALAPLIDWMSHYGAFWRERLDDLEALLKRMDQS